MGTGLIPERPLDGDHKEVLLYGRPGREQSRPDVFEVGRHLLDERVFIGSRGKARRKRLDRMKQDDGLGAVRVQPAPLVHHLLADHVELRFVNRGPEPTEFEDRRERLAVVLGGRIAEHCHPHLLRRRRPFDPSGGREQSV